MLAKVAANGDKRKLYACEVRRQDQFERKSDGKFDTQEFQDHPERWHGNYSGLSTNTVNE